MVTQNLYTKKYGQKLYIRQIVQKLYTEKAPRLVHIAQYMGGSRWDSRLSQDRRAVGAVKDTGGECKNIAYSVLRIVRYSPRNIAYALESPYPVHPIIPQILILTRSPPTHFALPLSRPTRRRICA